MLTRPHFHLPASYCLTCLVLIICYAAPDAASQVTLEWAAQMGDAGSDTGQALAVSPAGDVFTTGIFQGPADFDPGNGTFTLESLDFADIFVQRLTADGDLVWAFALEGTAPDVVRDVGVDADLNTYITGHYRDTLDFDPGAGTATSISAGGTDAYLAKFDAGGALQWAVTFGNTANTAGEDVAVAADGSVAIVGLLQDTLDVDPSPGIINLVSSGGSDVFVVKLDSDGQLAWAHSFGGLSGEFPEAITTDGGGNVLAAGRFDGTIDFEPGGGVTELTSAGDDDIFVVKLDGDGNFLWARNSGDEDDDFLGDIKTDASGNIILSGYYEDDTFREQDPFVQKLSPDGTELWKHVLGQGGRGAGRFFGVDVDDGGRIYSLGLSFNDLDLDPGPGSVVFSPLVQFNILLHALDANGNFLWAEIVAEHQATNDRGNDIAVDDAGSIFMTGSFLRAPDFDPGGGEVFLISRGSSDAYVQKVRATASTAVDDGPTARAEISTSIFPNPFDDVLTIRIESSPVPPFDEIEIIDLLGRTVLRSSTEKGDGSPIRLQTGQLPAGTYLVRVNNITAQAVSVAVKL